jgi:hypothetical protein
LFDDRGAGCNRRALHGAGQDLELAANQMDSLTHADESQPRSEPRGLDIEANGVIAYFQADRGRNKSVEPQCSWRRCASRYYAVLSHLPAGTRRYYQRLRLRNDWTRDVMKF